MTNRYEEPRPHTRQEAEHAFASGSIERITNALIGITFHDDDGNWVQDTCLSLSSHADPIVRRLAVVCLGHVARIHRRIDLARVIPVLERMLEDPDTAGAAQDALGDIRMFIK